jgi:glycine amidinotransferase
MQQTVVNSFNGWDPLEEVIVGTAFGATTIGWEPGFAAYLDDRQDLTKAPVAPRPAAEIDAAEAQLDNLARTLEQEGVLVRRPRPTDFFVPVRTPAFEVTGQNASVCPRDVLLVVGDEIIEAPMGLRSRSFEHLAYRPLVQEYFDHGARWTAAPRPSLSDDLYAEPGPTPDGEPHPALTEAEPCFDAASFVRLGKDIFYQTDIVTNDLGARWLGRHLGPGFRLHRARFSNPAPQHIDSTLIPLRAGLVMLNPDRLPTDGTAELFAENGWGIVHAPRPAGAVDSRAFISWISMNILNLDEETIICEEQEEPMLAFLESLGFRVLALPFRDVYSFGGSFHCATVDIRRRGGLQSYFPALDG